MTATLADVYDGIKLLLLDVDGLDNVYDYMPNSPTPPCAVVGLPTIWDGQTNMGGEQWAATIPVQLLVKLADNQNANRNLFALIDPVRAAFNDNPTVAVGADAIVTTADTWGVIVVDGAPTYLGATLNVDVLAG